MMICEADAFEQIADHDGTVFLASALKYTCNKKARITTQRMVPVTVYDMAVHKYRYIPRVVWYQVPGSLCRNKYIPYAVYVNGSVGGRVGDIVGASAWVCVCVCVRLVGGFVC